MLKKNLQTCKAQSFKIILSTYFSSSALQKRLFTMKRQFSVANSHPSHQTKVFRSTLALQNNGLYKLIITLQNNWPTLLGHLGFTARALIQAGNYRRAKGGVKMLSIKLGFRGATRARLPSRPAPGLAKPPSAKLQSPPSGFLHHKRYSPPEARHGWDALTHRRYPKLQLQSGGSQKAPCLPRETLEKEKKLKRW